MNIAGEDIEPPKSTGTKNKKTRADIYRPFLKIMMMEKYTVFRSPDDGEVYATRNVSPRFTVKYTPDGETSDIVFMDFLDDLRPDPIRLAKMMRGIGEAIARFLQNEEYERSKKR